MEFMKGRLMARFDGDRIFEIMDSIFTQNFKQVLRVRDLADAKASGADLAVVLDMFTEIKSVPKYEAAGLFFTVDGQPLATIKARGEAAQEYARCTYPNDAINCPAATRSFWRHRTKSASNPLRFKSDRKLDFRRRGDQSSLLG